jgi:hypothetical protein
MSRLYVDLDTPIPTFPSIKKKCCSIKGKDPWTIALVAFTFIVVILLATVAIITIVYNSDQFSSRRYCVQTGSVTLDGNDRSISWYVQYDSSLAPVNSLHIVGPILPGMSTATTIRVALCGSPSTHACILTVANVLQGKIGQLDPGGTPVTPAINEISSEPFRYYVTINNVTIGTMSGMC